MGKLFRTSLNPFFYSVSLFLFLSLASCSKTDETATNQLDTTSSVPTVNAIEEVASDKEKLRQAIILADSKGTLEAALTEAAQDSIIRDRLRAALVAAGGAARTASVSTKKSTSTTASTAAQKKDALDRTNDALDAANRTVERTATTVNKANEVGRKADELLRGKK